MPPPDESYQHRAAQPDIPLPEVEAALEHLKTAAENKAKRVKQGSVFALYYPGQSATVPPVARPHPDRNAAMVAAYATGRYRYREIGEYFGVHLATVGRIVRSRCYKKKTNPTL